VKLLGPAQKPRTTSLAEIQMASIGPVTSSTLLEQGLSVDIAAKEFTIPGLVSAIVKKFGERQ
jgi:uroporphyrinogen III methyltransferase/synthase